MWSRREESCTKPSFSARDGRIELLLSWGSLDITGLEGKTRNSVLDTRPDEITKGVNIVRKDEAQDRARGSPRLGR